MIEHLRTLGARRDIQLASFDELDGEGQRLVMEAFEKGLEAMEDAAGQT